MVLSEVVAVEYIPDLLGLSIVFVTDSFFLQLTVKVFLWWKLCFRKLGGFFNVVVGYTPFLERKSCCSLFWTCAIILLNLPLPSADEFEIAQEKCNVLFHSVRNHFKIHVLVLSNTLHKDMTVITS